MSLVADTPSRTLSVRKLAWIAGLAAATLLPDLLLSQLVGERQDRASMAGADVGTAWGPPQLLGGPVLAWPTIDKAGKPMHAALAPRSLDIRATVVPTTRRRGLFEATVFETSVAVIGSFELPNGARDEMAKAQAGGAETVLAVTVPGLQGLRDDDRVEISGAKLPWQPCAEVVADEMACRGHGNVLVGEVGVAAAKPAGSEKDVLPFAFTLHLRGTTSLRFATAAKAAAIRITGTWPTPGFGGELPAAAKLADGGFSADWAINRVGRPRFEGISTLADPVGATPVGVELLEGAPVYRTITRVEKYGLVIVVLAFAAYFGFEVMTGAAIGLLAYALLGAALTLFTLLLLSISEVAGYEAGYALSAALVTAQASLYTWSVTRRGRLALVFAAQLAGVFGFFYLLVGLESYALLVGAAALFVVLSIVMGLTQAVAARPLPSGAG